MCGVCTPVMCTCGCTHPCACIQKPEEKPGAYSIPLHLILLGRFSLNLEISSIKP